MPNMYLDQGKTDNDTFRYFSLYFPLLSLYVSPTFPLLFISKLTFHCKGKMKTKRSKSQHSQGSIIYFVTSFHTYVQYL